jgi:hypothetical protein
MDDQTQDNLMLSVFSSLRRELEGEYGTELGIIDNQAYRWGRIRSRRAADDDQPNFRIVIRGGVAAIAIRRVQKGFAAGPVQRRTVRQDEADLHGRIVEIVRSCIQAERKRLIEFRESQG